MIELIFAVLPVLYVLPSVIAMARRVPGWDAIVWLNLLFGWTVVFWFQALHSSLEPRHST